MTIKRVAYFTDIPSYKDLLTGDRRFILSNAIRDIGSYSYTSEGSSAYSGINSSTLIVAPTMHNTWDDHPMDPRRLRMVHSLVLSLGLHRKKNFREHPIRSCSDGDIRAFHSRKYMDFLSDPQLTSSINAPCFQLDENQLLMSCIHNVGPIKLGVDCTAFDGLWEFNKKVVGASLDAAHFLCTDQADIAINWSGGMHHAKRENAAGFCYLNDCVLAIVELLRVFERILYIDIDFHHGDGVEEAFYTTNKVCTVSFHRFGPKRVFPGTGSLDDIGQGDGKFYTVNVPLLGGIGDDTYVYMFTTVIKAVVDKFNPTAIVLQCGADSLAGDTLGMENGSFNLSSTAHAECVRFVRDLDKPLLVLGGGGYSTTSVAKCWAVETAILCGIEHVPSNIPSTDHYYSEYKEKSDSFTVQSHKDVVDFNSPGRIQHTLEVVLGNIALMGSSSNAQH